MFNAYIKKANDDNWSYIGETKDLTPPETVAVIQETLEKCLNTRYTLEYAFDESNNIIDIYLIPLEPTVNSCVDITNYDIS